MSDQSPETWPLRPSHASSVTHALCMALSDLLHEEGGGEISRRAYIKMCGLVTAAELFSSEAARWYFTRMCEDHDLLEELEDRYEEEEQSA